MTQTSFTEEEVSAWFGLLRDALDRRGLRNKAGRRIQADDFMLMHAEHNHAGARVAAFKHIDTRDYIFVNGHGYAHVPREGKPFMRGAYLD